MNRPFKVYLTPLVVAFFMQSTHGFHHGVVNRPVRLHPSTEKKILPANIGFRSAPTSVCQFSNKDELEGDDEDEIKASFSVKERDIPGFTFLSVLIFWHFWLGPALKPILLDMRQ